jgi:hypothetical protein
MTTPTVEAPLRTHARAAGILRLIIIVGADFSEGFVRAGLYLAKGVRAG